MIDKYESDTIVGVSTALSNSAIAVIRVSGSDAINIVSHLFKGKRPLNEVKSHRVLYGHIYDDQKIVDEVLVSIFRAPKTYTKEDVVEISCHGGLFVTNQIVKCLVKKGARLAGAGEFTKRAFLNGRIDLTKAEAVMDVIAAENENALKIAHQGLRGDIYNTIVKKRNELLEMMAIIAVNIDYPEYDDVVEMTNSQLKAPLLQMVEELKQIIKHSNDAEKIKKGIDTVIIGQPNVGKSSILNALMKEEKAIVTNIPGTTRDIVEGRVYLGDLMLNLMDTAGIRETSDLVEQIGVLKSLEQIKKADLILFVADASKPLNEEDLKILKTIKKQKHLIIMNKKDLGLSKNNNYLEGAIYISSYDAQDVLALERHIADYVFEETINLTNYLYVSSARQIGKLHEALNALLKALDDIAAKVDIDLIDLSIKEAWNALGEIIGEVSPDDLLDELFSKFCLGK